MPTDELLSDYSRLYGLGGVEGTHTAERLAEQGYTLDEQGSVVEDVAPKFTDAMSSSYDENSLTGVIQHSVVNTTDYGWLWTEELVNEYTKDLPYELHDYVLESRSEDTAKARRASALTTQENRKILSKAYQHNPISTFLGELAVGALDPALLPTYFIGIGGGMAVARSTRAATRLSNAIRYGRNGMIYGAVENGLVELAATELAPDRDAQDVLYATLGGGVLGGSLSTVAGSLTRALDYGTIRALEGMSGKKILNNKGEYHFSDVKEAAVSMRALDPEHPQSLHKVEELEQYKQAVSDIKQKLMPEAGNKLSRGEVKTLKAELHDLNYKLKQSKKNTTTKVTKDLKQEAKDLLGGKRNQQKSRKIKHFAEELNEHQQLQEEGLFQNRIDNINSRLAAHQKAAEAESALSRLETFEREGYNPKEIFESYEQGVNPKDLPGRTQEKPLDPTPDEVIVAKKQVEDMINNDLVPDNYKDILRTADPVNVARIIKNVDAAREDPAALAKAIAEMPEMNWSPSDLGGISHLLNDVSVVLTHPIPEVRFLGAALIQNNRGNKDGSPVVISASTIQAKIQRKAHSKYMLDIGKDIREWQKTLPSSWSKVVNWRFADTSAFHEQVTQAARSKEVFDKAPPYIQNRAKVAREVLDELFGDMQDAGVPSATQSKHIPDYVPRMMDIASFFNVILPKISHNQDRAVKLLAENVIKRAWIKKQPELYDQVRTMLENKIFKTMERQELEGKNVTQRSQEYIDKKVDDYINKVSLAYAKGIQKIPNNEKGMLEAGQRLDDPDELINNLTEELTDLMDEGTTRADIQELVTLMVTGSPLKKGKERMVNLRSRLHLDETAKFPVPTDSGKIEMISVSDFTINSMQDLIMDYSFRAGASVGLARNGIDTHDMTFDKWMRIIDQSFINRKAENPHLDLAGSKDKVEKILHRLYKGLKGKEMVDSDLISDKTRSRLQMLRDFNFMRVMNLVGMSQMVEVSTVVAANALKHNLRTVSHFNQLYKRAADGSLDNKALDEIIMATGVGTHFSRGSNRSRYDEPGEWITTTHSKLNWMLGAGRGVTSTISGMHFLTDMSQRVQIFGMLQRWTDAAFKDTKAYPSIALQQTGLDEAMGKRIIDNMRTHVQMDESGFPTVLNGKQWEPEVWDSFQNHVALEVTNLVQEADIGSNNSLIRSAIGRTLFQFLGFPIAAAEHQTGRLYNRAVNGDPVVSARILSAQMAAATMVHIGRVYLLAQGRPDQQEYIERHMTPAAVAIGAFSYTSGFGFYSFLGGIPNVLKDGAGSAFIANPTLDLMDSATRTLVNLGTQADDMSFTQWRAAARLLPYQNALLVNHGLNILSSQGTSSNFNN